jgi:hypothetical protein
MSLLSCAVHIKYEQVTSELISKRAEQQGRHTQLKDMKHIEKMLKKSDI